MLVNCKVVGQLKKKCIGPFIFVRYMGERGLNAELKGVGGKLRSESVANLLPVRHHPQPPAPTPEDFDSSSTSGSSISDPVGIKPATALVP